MVRLAHHPEESRGTNSNDRNLKLETDRGGRMDEVREKRENKKTEEKR